MQNHRRSVEHAGHVVIPNPSTPVALVHRINCRRHGTLSAQFIDSSGCTRHSSPAVRILSASPPFPLPHESAPPPLGGRSPVPFRPRHRIRLRRHLQRGPLPPPGPHRRRRMDRAPQPQRGQCRPLRLAHQRRHRLHLPLRHRHPRQGPPRHRPQPSHRRHPQRPRPMVRRSLQPRRNPPPSRQ